MLAPSLSLYGHFGLRWWIFAVPLLALAYLWVELSEWVQEDAPGESWEDGVVVQPWSVVEKKR
jgi:hypothetical protein